MVQIAKYERSVIPAVDVKPEAFTNQKVSPMDTFKSLVEQTHDVEGIGGYKIGAALTIYYGLPKLVRIVKRYTDLPVILDLQKGMTDIPDTGVGVLSAIKSSGASGFIGFPMSGPATQEAWTKAAQNLGLPIILGGEMTHPKYKRSEGGYISDDALSEIYLLGARMGVTNFVVPGTKIDKINYYRSILEPEIKEQISFWAPGFVTQGGVITDAAKAAGRSFHAIVGRAIFEAEDMHSAALELTSQIKRD